MKLSGLGSDCIHIESYGIHWPCYGNISCSGQIAIECVIIGFTQVHGFYLLDFQSCVEAHVAEIIVVNLAGQDTFPVKTVTYAYVIEVQSFFIYVERPVSIVIRPLLPR